jgi:hypothetical protein
MDIFVSLHAPSQAIETTALALVHFLSLFVTLLGQPLLLFPWWQTNLEFHWMHRMQWQGMLTYLGQSWIGIDLSAVFEIGQKSGVS